MFCTSEWRFREFTTQKLNRACIIDFRIRLASMSSRSSSIFVTEIVTLRGSSSDELSPGGMINDGRVCLCINEVRPGGFPFGLIKVLLFFRKTNFQ